MKGNIGEEWKKDKTEKHDGDQGSVEVVSDDQNVDPESGLLERRVAYRHLSP